MRASWLNLAGRWDVRALFSAIVSMALVVPAWAELEGPAAGDRQVTLAVTALMRHQHLSRRKLDDELSERCAESFLKALDKWKVYFYQSDIDEFSKRRHDLDDMALKGDVSFAYDVFNRFLERVEGRVKTVDELLALDHDFTVDEEMTSDPDLLSFPKDEDEAKEAWRKRIKYEILVEKSEGSDLEKARAKLTKRYHSFARRMKQIDRDELLEMYLGSLTGAYDPHSAYMSPESLETFEIAMRLNLEGIGASLQSVDGETIVNTIIRDGAAFKEGHLKTGDQVTGVGQGDEGEIVDTTEMKLSDVVDMIRGKAGTIVRLEVIPAGQTDKQIYTITRAKVELEDSAARGDVKEVGQKSDGTPYLVGVIDLPSFYMDMEANRRGQLQYRSSTRDVQKILNGFREKHVDAVILDLRHNGGGSLTEAVNLTGLFIDSGPVVQIKDADQVIEQKDDLDEGAAWGGPLVVLTSKGSASASEILAGTIQDYGRGLIIGDRSTFGKGTVQTLMDLGQQLFDVPNAPKLGALKLTQQQFYLPSGKSTQMQGVTVDVELPSLISHLPVGESDLDYCLECDEIQSVLSDEFHRLDKSLLDKLGRLSKQRCEASPDFEKVLAKIARFEEQQSKKAVSLNEAKFLADLNAEREEEKLLEEELEAADKPVFDLTDYYNAEALAITLDFLRLEDVAQTN